VALREGRWTLSAEQIDARLSTVRDVHVSGVRAVPEGTAPMSADAYRRVVVRS
jgi:hypothetical protein